MLWRGEYEIYCRGGKVDLRVVGNHWRHPQTDSQLACALHAAGISGGFGA